MLFRGEFSTFGFCPRTHRQRDYFHSVDAAKMQLFTFQPERSILGKVEKNSTLLIEIYVKSLLRNDQSVHNERDFHRYFTKSYDLQKIFGPFTYLAK